jgi:hypothetical protein
MTLDAHNFGSDSQSLWNDEEPLGGQAKQITVALDGLGRMQMFYVGLDDKLFQNIQTGSDDVLWSGQQQVSRDKAKYVVAIQDSNENINLFYIGTDNHIHQNIQTDAANNVWSGDVKWPWTAHDIAVAMDVSGVIHMVFIGTNLNQVYHTFQTDIVNNIWSSNPLSLDGQTANSISIAATAGSGLHIFFIATDSAIYHVPQTQAGNDTWAPIPSRFSGDSAKQLDCITAEDDNIHIFYVGSDEKLFHNWQTDHVNWFGQTDFANAKGKEIKAGMTAAGLELFYVGTNNGLYQNWQVTTQDEADNSNWHGPVRMAAYYGHSASAKSITVGQTPDGRLEIFYVGTNDDIYHNWQITPMGIFQSNTNQYIYSNCQPITNLKISIKVLTDIVEQEVDGTLKGFTFQLNANSPVGSKSAWQQYVIGIHGTYIGGSVENWPESGGPLGTDNFNIISMPSRTIPAGYELIISLQNDADNNVVTAKFQVIDNFGDTIANVSKNVKSIVHHLAPIVAIQVDLVGPYNGEHAILSSGSGTITYTADNRLIGLNTQSPTCAAIGMTAEEANSVYGAVGKTPSATLTQSFGIVTNEATASNGQ